jgi:hypothetical protein
VIKGNAELNLKLIDLHPACIFKTLFKIDLIRSSDLTCSSTNLPDLMPLTRFSTFFFNARFSFSLKRASDVLRFIIDDRLLFIDDRRRVNALASDTSRLMALNLKFKATVGSWRSEAVWQGNQYFFEIDAVGFLIVYIVFVLIVIVFENLRIGIRIIDHNYFAWWPLCDHKCARRAISRYDGWFGFILTEEVVRIDWA